MEHLSEILNRDNPTNPGEEDEIVESEGIEEIDLGRWRLQEVKDALNVSSSLPGFVLLANQFDYRGGRRITSTRSWEGHLSQNKVQCLKVEN